MPCKGPAEGTLKNLDPEAITQLVRTLFVESVVAGTEASGARRKRLVDSHVVDSTIVELAIAVTPANARKTRGEVSDANQAEPLVILRDLRPGFEHRSIQAGAMR